MSHKSTNLNNRFSPWCIFTLWSFMKQSHLANADLNFLPKPSLVLPERHQRFLGMLLQASKRWVENQMSTMTEVSWQLNDQWEYSRGWLQTLRFSRLCFEQRVRMGDCILVVSSGKWLPNHAWDGLSGLSGWGMRERESGAYRETVLWWRDASYPAEEGDDVLTITVLF